MKARELRVTAILYHTNVKNIYFDLLYQKILYCVTLYYIILYYIILYYIILYYGGFACREKPLAQSGLSRTHCPASSSASAHLKYVHMRLIYVIIYM